MNKQGILVDMHDNHLMLHCDRRQLSNGIRINYFDMPWARSVCLHFSFLGGSSCETSKNNGATHVLEHILMQYLRKSDSTYDMLGWYRGSTDVDFIDLEVVTRIEKSVGAIRLLSRAFQLEMHDLMEQLPIAKQSVLEEISCKADLFDLKSDRELIQGWWGQFWHRFNPLGLAQTVRHLKPTELVPLATSCLQPSRLIISLAGATASIRAEIEPILEQLTPHLEGKTNHPEAIATPTFPGFVRKHWIEGGESRLTLAYPTFGALHSDFFAEHVIHTILSNVERSSLYHCLQHPRPLAYDIHCSRSLHRHFSVISIEGWVRKQSLLPALRNVLSYIDGLAAHGFSEDEFRAGVEKALTELASAADSPGQLLSLYNQYLALGWIDNPEQRLRTMTLNELNQVAARVFGAAPALILFTPRDIPGLNLLSRTALTSVPRVES